MQQELPNNTPFGLHLDPQVRDRRVVRTASILIILGVVGVAGHLVLVSGYLGWQIVGVVGGFAIQVVCSLAALFSVRLGKGEQAPVVLLAGLLVQIFAITLFVANTYTTLGIAAFVAVVLLANLILEQRQVQWAILAAAGMFLASRLLNWLFPNLGLDIPVLGQIINLAAIVVTTFLAILVLKSFRSFSLTSKLTAAIISLTLLLAVIVGYYTASSTTLALQQSVGESLASMGRTQAKAAGDLLNSQVDALTSFSLGDVVQRSVVAANNAYGGNSQSIRSILEDRDRAWRAAIADKNDAASLVRSRMINTASRDLQEFIRVFPAYSEVMLTDVNGGLISASGMTQDYNQSDEEWWQKVNSTPQGVPYLSAPYYDADSRGYVIRIAVPVRERANNTLVGVLGSTYRVNNLFAQVSSTRFGVSGQPDLYFPGENPLILHGDGIQEVSADFLEDLNAYGDAVYREMDYNGVRSLVSRAEVVSDYGETKIADLGWAIMVHQDSEEAFAPVDAQVNTISLIVAVLISLTAGLAVGMAQFVTAPVTRLTRTAESVRAGDLTAKANVESNDEIGLLASTFNDMTRQLSLTLSGLERRVDERTRELSLSGEVGRTLSQERHLERLLQSAVDRIQQAFDLYYVQMYLMDPIRHDLVLQAGSGAVGMELMQKAHRLAIGPGSINGSAAADKQPVLVANTAESGLFKANLLLPETRAELSVPLLLGERVVGVLDMQSRTIGTLSPESLPAFQSLASQLAVAVENASLFSEAEAARMRMEEQMRMQSRAGWGSFLDAIHNNERLGYRYDSTKRAAVAWTGDVKTDQSEGQDHTSLDAPIVVTGETVGAISLQREAGEAWSPMEKDLVRTVAEQVARQIDSLRLLAQADQYRAEAESAARRMTREGWDEFLTGSGEGDYSFVYDQNRVVSEPEASGPAETASVAINLVVQDEPIGELAVEGIEPADEESLELIRTVTSRLSEHIEGIRLLEQTQSALVQVEQSQESLRAHEENLQKQNAAIATLTRSEAIGQGNLEVALQEITANAAQTLDLARVGLWLFNEDRTAIRCVDLYEKDKAAHSSGLVLERGSYPAYFAALLDDAIIAANDARTHPATAELAQTYLEPLGITSRLDAPFRFGGRVIGVLSSEHIGPARRWQPEDLSFATSLCDIAALAYEAKQRQSRTIQEQRIREVTEQVFSAADVNSIMRRAVEQVGRVLGAPAYIYVGQTNGKPAGSDGGQPGKDISETEQAV